MEKQSKRQHDCERCGKQLQLLISHVSTPGGFMSLYSCESCGLVTSRNDPDDVFTAFGLVAGLRSAVMNASIH